MKVIETEYGGYLFRSRLEARWAVYLDKLRVEWEYEIEGYEFENGLKYLPDFYLPTYDVFLEIKGGKPNRLDLKKAELLSTLKPVIIFSGLPGKQSGMCYLFDSNDSSAGEDWREVDFYHGITTDSLYLCVQDFCKHRKYMTPDTYSSVKIVNLTADIMVDMTMAWFGPGAIDAAKRARFEHGATPVSSHDTEGGFRNPVPRMPKWTTKKGYHIP